jgi:hypothetical protein
LTNAREIKKRNRRENKETINIADIYQIESHLLAAHSSLIEINLCTFGYFLRHIEKDIEISLLVQETNGKFLLCIYESLS